MEHRELERIRFVAERYHELQGLRSVCVGSAMAASQGVALLIRWPPDETAWFAAIAAMFALAIPGMLWLDRYYRSRFGKTAPPRGFWTIGNLMPLAMVPLFMFDVMHFDARLGLYFLAYASFALWVSVRDWRYREYHVINVALGGVAAIMSARLGAAFGAYPPAVMTGFLLIGSGMIVTGFLDHQLMVSAMPPPQGPQEQGHADSI